MTINGSSTTLAGGGWERGGARTLRAARPARRSARVSCPSPQTLARTTFCCRCGGRSSPGGGGRLGQSWKRAGVSVRLRRRATTPHRGAALRATRRDGQRRAGGRGRTGRTGVVLSPSSRTSFSATEPGGLALLQILAFDPAHQPFRFKVARVYRARRACAAPAAAQAACCGERLPWQVAGRLACMFHLYREK